MMVAERGASENTVSAYRRDLEEFSLFLHRRGRRIEGSDTENIGVPLQLRHTKKIDLYPVSAPISSTSVLFVSPRGVSPY